MMIWPWQNMPYIFNLVNVAKFNSDQTNGKMMTPYTKHYYLYII